MTKKIKFQALQKVCQNRETAQEIANRCGISRAAVYMWASLGKVPAEHALTVARYFKVSPNRVRPDIYPKSILRKFPARKRVSIS